VPQTLVSGGVTFTIPDTYVISSFGAHVTQCRACQQTILFAAHRTTGKRMPLNPDGTSHFSNCPEADTFRRG
jgi:Zn-dependent alcohol dehydrogenase